MPASASRAWSSLRSFLRSGAARDVVYGAIAWALLAYTFLGLLSEPVSLPTSSAPGRLGPLLGAVCGLLGVALLVVLYRRERFVWMVAGAFIGCPLAWVFAMGQHLPVVSSRTQRDLRDDVLYRDAVERVFLLTEHKGAVDPEARCRKLRLLGFNYAVGIGQDAVGLTLRRGALVQIWARGCATGAETADALRALAQAGGKMRVPLGWFAPFRRERDRAVAEMAPTGDEWCLNNPAWEARVSPVERQVFCQGQPEGFKRSFNPPDIRIPQAHQGPV